MTKRDKSSARNVTKSLLRDYASKRLCFQASPGAHGGSALVGDVTPDVTTASENVTTAEAEFLADYYSHLHANLSYLFDFFGILFQHLGVNTEIANTHQRLT